MGLVITNAMLYDPGALKFENDALTLGVAGAHLGFDGSVFMGTCDIAMRSEKARCLYNFISAPTNASVSVPQGMETQNIATEIVNEKDSWLSVSAEIFTFSSPTIRLKLSQGTLVNRTLTATPTSSARPTPSPKPTVVKKLTITCVKGKLVKKVTAVKPVCPKNYKKK